MLPSILRRLFALVLAVSWSFVHSTPFAVDKTFRVAQLGSAALYSLGHGGNDAQKTMGIIAGLLYAEGHLGSQFYVPLWVVLDRWTVGIGRDLCSPQPPSTLIDGNANLT